jgi:hypothetical protein
MASGGFPGAPRAVLGENLIKKMKIFARARGVGVNRSIEIADLATGARR